MTTAKKTIFDKIRALRARAECDASTEAEAAMAARKAAELMEQHNLSISEIDVRADGVDRADWHGNRKRPYEAYTLHGIGQLCNVRAFYSGRTISVIGAPADRELALYYLDLTRATVDSAWRTYRRSLDYQRAVAYDSPTTIAHAFKLGVVTRLGKRFAEMAPKAEAAPTGGTALVPVKQALIADYMRGEGIHLRNARAGRVGSSSGYEAGRAAGDRASLSRGIAGGHGGQRRLA